MGKENAEIALSLVGYEEELKVCFLEFQFIITLTTHIPSLFCFLKLYVTQSWVVKAFSMSFQFV